MFSQCILLLVTLLINSLTFQHVSTWLIRSGEPVREQSEFPFIALLMTETSMCTATLISAKAVITAGHCVCGTKSINRIAFLALSDFDHRAVNHDASEIKIPPEYEPTCQLKRENKRVTQSFGGYDMAIVLLTKMVNLESGIKVISLPSESDIPMPASIVYIVGYGADVKDPDPSGRYGGILKKGRATVMKCRHRTIGNPICIQPGPDDKQISGPGDSGGPLLLSPQGPIIGVASNGLFLPNLGDLCVEYSSVARLLQFILSNI
uniref:Elastase 2b n=1 Tax=Schistosoma japonicum TaxID=6182 RepID=U3RF04_SCHJA|nr:elastase 2b [Schistosoma japonicum]